MNFPLAAIMVDASMSTTMRPLADPLAETRLGEDPRHLASCLYYKVVRQCEYYPVWAIPGSIYIISMKRNIEKAMR